MWIYITHVTGLKIFKKKKKKKKTLYFQLEIVLKNAIPFQEAVYMYNISVKKRN